MLITSQVLFLVFLFFLPVYLESTGSLASGTFAALEVHRRPSSLRWEEPSVISGLRLAALFQGRRAFILIRSQPAPERSRLLGSFMESISELQSRAETHRNARSRRMSYVTPPYEAWCPVAPPSPAVGGNESLMGHAPPR